MRSASWFKMTANEASTVIQLIHSLLGRPLFKDVIRGKRKKDQRSSELGHKPLLEYILRFCSHGVYDKAVDVENCVENCVEN